MERELLLGSSAPASRDFEGTFQGISRLFEAFTAPKVIVFEPFRLRNRPPKGCRGRSENPLDFSDERLMALPNELQAVATMRQQTYYDLLLMREDLGVEKP